MNSDNAGFWIKPSPVRAVVARMALAITNSSESVSPCCSSGNKMSEHCQPTNVATPTMQSKNEPRKLLSSLSFRNVIMCDSIKSLAFWRPKKTHNLVMPHSMTVCLTIGCESVNRCDTVWCNISCRALNSVSYRTVGCSCAEFNCVWSKKYKAVSAISAVHLIVVGVIISFKFQSTNDYENERWQFINLPTFRA